MSISRGKPMRTEIQCAPLELRDAVDSSLAGTPDIFSTRVFRTNRTVTPRVFKKDQSSTIRIGPSGWHHRHWLKGFYPAKLQSGKLFPWYARHFNTVEVNNTFYRLPTEDALGHWRQTAPAGFLFSVKASRFITHTKRLLDPEESVVKFLSRVELLGNTLGPILFQLPPKFRLNLARLEKFLEVLPTKHMYAFEFRDVTWRAPPVYKLLRRYNAAFCIHDWQGGSSHRELAADFVYVRFHGPTGSYSLEFVAKWADQIRQWSGRQIFVYFNNDVGGHAVTNAITLRSLLQKQINAGAKAA